MTKVLLFSAGAAVVMLTASAGHLRAQAPQGTAGAHESGIFAVLPGESAETQIKGSLGQQKTKGVAKSMLTQGFSKPSLEYHLNGAASSLRLTSGEATYYFYFSEAPNPKSPPPMPDPTMVMSQMNNMYSALPPLSKNGAGDFVLLRLQTGDGERIADMGKSPGNKPKDPIAFVAEKTGALTYKLKTKDPLAPGEYAFNFVGMGSAGGIFWDFAITAK